MATGTIKFVYQQTKNGLDSNPENLRHFTKREREEWEENTFSKGHGELVYNSRIYTKLAEMREEFRSNGIMIDIEVKREMV